MTPSERREYRRDNAGRWQRMLFHAHHAEDSVFPAVIGQEPDRNGRQQDNRSRFLNEAPAAFPGRAEKPGDRRPVISRQLHDEEQDRPRTSVFSSG